MKRSLGLFGILFILFSAFIVQGQQDPNKRFRVVIDPGHGGHDPGAIGRKVKEKDIVLAISRKLGQYIQQNMPDVEVLYTRETDVFVELFRRAQIANQSRADLFISIHCNSVKNSKPTGTETWVMGLHRSDANLEVARAENAVVLMEDNYEEQYDGFDPNSPESHILFTLFQNAYLDQSLDMASLVQDQFRERARRVDRGVKQAGFLVLYRVTMPGILVEAGFISNPEEEAYLASEEGQSQIASAIYRALRDYREQLSKADGRSSRLSYQGPNPEKPLESSPAANSPLASPDATTMAQTRTTDIRFAVQIKSSASKLKPADASFKGLKEVKEYIQQGAYKYYVGEHRQFTDALTHQQELRKKGFSDAFVIALRNGQRMPLAEARALTGN